MDYPVTAYIYTKGPKGYSVQDTIERWLFDTTPDSIRSAAIDVAAYAQPGDRIELRDKISRTSDWFKVGRMGGAVTVTKSTPVRRKRSAAAKKSNPIKRKPKKYAVSSGGAALGQSHVRGFDSAVAAKKAASVGDLIYVRTPGLLGDYAYNQNYYRLLGTKDAGGAISPGRRKSNPATTGKASRWGVYVKNTLAYVSAKKLDANKAASKLKLSGRAFIKVKRVNPNPITGKLPVIGWRTQFKKAAYAAVKTPAGRRKMASRDSRTRQTRERRRENPKSSSPVYKLVESGSRKLYRSGDYGDGDAYYFGGRYGGDKAEAQRVANLINRQGGRTGSMRVVVAPLRAARKRNASSLLVRNPSRRRNGADEARELELYASNDGSLYRTYTQPIMRTLASKKERGTYTRSGAVTAFKRLANAAANKYRREFGTADSPIFSAADKEQVAREFADYFEAEYKLGNVESGRRRNPARKLSRTSRKGTAHRRNRYLVEVGGVPAWVGRLKTDADKAWRKLTDAGHKQVNIFKAEVTKTVKDGWRKAFKGVTRKSNPTVAYGPPGTVVKTRAEWGSVANAKDHVRRHGGAAFVVNNNGQGGTVYTLGPGGVIRIRKVKRNPSFPGRLGSGKRFAACVRKVSRQAGVYDPEGLCASIGRKKYGKKGMAKLAAKGRKRNPERLKKGPYSNYSSAQEWGMKLRLKGHTNIRIDKLTDGWWVYWTVR